MKCLPSPAEDRVRCGTIPKGQAFNRFSASTLVRVLGQIKGFFTISRGAPGRRPGRRGRPPCLLHLSPRYLPESYETRRTDNNKTTLSTSPTLRHEERATVAAVNREVMIGYLREV